MRSTASKSSEFTTTKGETVTEIPKKESVSIPEKTLPVQTQLKKKNSYSESDGNFWLWLSVNCSC